MSRTAEVSLKKPPASSGVIPSFRSNKGALHLWSRTQTPEIHAPALFFVIFEEVEVPSLLQGTISPVKRVFSEVKGMCSSGLFAQRMFY